MRVMHSSRRRRRMPRNRIVDRSSPVEEARPGVGGRRSQPPGCAQRTIPRSPKVTTRRSTRLAQPWQSARPASAPADYSFFAIGLLRPGAGRTTNACSYVKWRSLSAPFVCCQWCMRKVAICGVCSERVNNDVSSTRRTPSALEQRRRSSYRCCRGHAGGGRQESSRRWCCDRRRVGVAAGREGDGCGGRGSA
jgi:hypothetical protein